MNKRTRKKWLKKQGLYVNPKETWNLDYTIAKFVLPRLKLFKKLNNGYPGREGMETEEKWDEALDKMIWSFEQIINDNSWNNYGIDFTHDPDCMKKYKEINDKIHEGLELFGKWFMHLWW